MNENVAKIINAMQEVLKKTPREAAEKLAADATNRAEAVADYVEMATGGKLGEEA